MKKVNFGIVGLGRLGRAHAENLAFKIPNANLLAVCSIYKNQVEEIQHKLGTLHMDILTLMKC
ncbi:Gfo/Idh/MocA family oxidoreductase [Clostridium botulinum]|uniref:Gfo/Idh/MocA family oxidoreductase n=1 Tax=Clostridium TaxID=1485 RepID=UPI00031ABD76|nr:MULTISPECIES: Gfo/Idh/MocA family oxidoreductase [Clostridium]AIY80446.1 myo-inositol 2-dehydrogenase domain protein [Clostridium botulinum 202F]KAI3344134.1 Gfo/Idh/MocA family oxidoreductase [Clostridium botulinum]MBZ9693092.1 Gfo/Idh/MocA family oxidoreductase [Clostridium sp. M14]MCR1132952.1 Gfo/Idh/MocA family oxidoreductase [Clostridium botulinum]